MLISYFSAYARQKNYVFHAYTTYILQYPQYLNKSPPTPLEVLSFVLLGSPGFSHYVQVTKEAVPYSGFFSSVQMLSLVRFFVTPWTVVHQASLSITNSWTLFKFMSTESVMSSNHLIPFSSCLQSFPASGSFQVSQFFI